MHDEVYHNKTVSIPKLHPIIWTVRNVHRLTVDSNCPCWRFTNSTSNKDNKIQIRMIQQKSIIFKSDSLICIKIFHIQSNLLWYKLFNFRTSNWSHHCWHRFGCTKPITIIISACVITHLIKIAKHVRHCREFSETTSR